MCGSVGSWPVYNLFDPSGKTLWLSIDHCRLKSFDDMVLSCVVGESGFIASSDEGL